MIQGNPVLRVSQLVQAIRQLVEGVPGWQKVWVEAELSGGEAPYFRALVLYLKR